MQRRELLKGLGGAAGVATVGGIGVLATNTASATTGVSGHETISGQNDDGEVQFVGYGGKLTYEWDGLDTEAKYGRYELETRIREVGDNFGGWRSMGSDTGELGANWGDDNDRTDRTGTQGEFFFKYGSQYGQEDYGIAYNSDVADDPGDYGPNGLRLVPSDKAYDTSLFEADSDGSTKKMQIEFRYTCSVLDGDPDDGGSVITGSEATDTARLTVEMTNEPAEGDTENEVSGVVGDAE